MMYHSHYIAIVWNKDDYSDLQILSHTSFFNLIKKAYFFDNDSDAIKISKTKGFNNCITTRIFHTKM